jgi:hypothetical protein
MTPVCDYPCLPISRLGRAVARERSNERRQGAGWHRRPRHGPRRVRCRSAWPKCPGGTRGKGIRSGSVVQGIVDVLVSPRGNGYKVCASLRVEARTQRAILHACGWRSANRRFSSVVGAKVGGRMQMPGRLDPADGYGGKSDMDGSLSGLSAPLSFYHGRRLLPSASPVRIRSASLIQSPGLAWIYPGHGQENAELKPAGG